MASLSELEIRQFARVVEQTADTVLITDRQGRIEYVNPSFEQQTGYTLAEIRGQSPSILKSDKHPREFYTRLWRTILKGEAFTDVVINRRRDGSLFYEEKTITPLRNEAGEITHFVATAKDITTRWLIEQDRIQLVETLRQTLEQLRKNEAELERRVEERTRDLRQALAEVKTLTGLIPICAQCKKVRDDRGYWNQVESYIGARTQARFSHGICPECAKILYPEFDLSGGEKTPRSEAGS